MFCQYCGTEAADGCKFCPSCGAQLQTPQPVQQQPVIQSQPIIQNQVQQRVNMEEQPGFQPVVPPVQPADAVPEVNSANVIYSAGRGLIMVLAVIFFVAFAVLEIMAMVRGGYIWTKVL